MVNLVFHACTQTVRRSQTLLSEGPFLRDYGFFVHLIFSQATHGGSARWETLF